MKIFLGYELFGIFSNGRTTVTGKSIGIISNSRFFVYLKSWPSLTVTYSPKRKTTNLSCKCLECWIVEPYTKIVWQQTESMACFVCFSFQMEMRGWGDILCSVRKWFPTHWTNDTPYSYHWTTYFSDFTFFANKMNIIRCDTMRRGRNNTFWSYLDR